MRTPRRLRLEGHAGSRQPLTKAAVKGWIHTGTGTYTRRDMRILHTSDWHLGRHFGTQPLLEDQREFLRWLLEVVKEHRVELVVVAGDVFDRAVPAAEAVEAWREALLRLRSLDARVVAIAGNHDGPARLAAYDGLTDLAGVWVRGGYARAGEILSIEGSDGPLAIVPLPFLDPLLAPTPAEDAPDAASIAPGAATGAAAAGATSPEPAPADPPPAVARPTHESVLRTALERAGSSIGGRRSVVLAHAWVSGGLASDSERALTVGGAGQVEPSLFDGFSYVALGHLHRPQSVGGRENLRYCGSPLSYSFSEEHDKQVLLLDLAPTGSVSIEPLAVPVGRKVATLTGRLEELLRAPEHEHARGRWVRVRLTDTGIVLDAKTRLRKRFPHVVEVALAATSPGRGEAPTDAHGAGGPAKSSHELALDFWSKVMGESADPRVSELLRSALEHARPGQEDA